MNGFLRLALQPSVVRRACKFAAVVGVVLISINHGRALLLGDVTRERFFQMGLTVLVPFVVSTLSSVQAVRELERRRADERREIVRAENAETFVR